MQPHHNPTAYLPRRGGVWYAPEVNPSARPPPSVQPPSIRRSGHCSTPPRSTARATANSSRLLAWRSTRPMRPEVSPSSTRQPRNSGDAGPEIGEEWCGSWKLFWPDGRPMAHDECPMAIAIKRAVPSVGTKVWPNGLTGPERRSSCIRRSSSTPRGLDRGHQRGRRRHRATPRRGCAPGSQHREGRIPRARVA